MSLKNTFYKLFHWEYWPAYLLYIPNIPYACYLVLKAKHITFFTAANPGIQNSGNGTESKYKTLLLVPEEYRPNTILILPKTPFKTVETQLKEAALTFPLIAKPDVGFRGLLVKKIDSLESLKKYLHQYPVTMLAQEFLAHEHECGLFYSRIPGQESGQISSITLKHFLTVKGDGVRTLKVLISANKRSRLYVALFQKIHQEKMLKVLPKNETLTLTAIGNHSKGTQFINGNYLISKKLTETIDKLSKSIPGWYYGRIDLKYNDFTSVENGSDFKILEVNGIISEPTHIYDSEQSSYFKALQSIRVHWKKLFLIATHNHYKKQIPYTSPQVFIQELIQLKKYTTKITSLSKK